MCAGVKLTWKQTQSYSGWVKYVGKNPDGRPRCFYLGRDRADAELKALRLAAGYKAILRSGGDCWTEEAVRAALGDATVPLPAPAAPQRPPVAPPASPAPPDAPRVISSGLTLHAAIDEYLAYEERRAPSQVTLAYVYGVRIRVARYKRLLPDCPLAEVGYDRLAEWVARFASRPTSGATGRRIGVVTAADAIKGMRAMFDWFDLSDRWVAPRRFERIFRVKRRSLQTADERDAEFRGVQVFTVEELRKIMEMGWTRWHRVFVATAINLALTQNELSTLKRQHVLGLDTDAPAVEKRREKTDIFCRWGYLFPEVAEGLRWLLSSHNSQYVFVTADGKQPVRFCGGSRVDTVTSWWRRLVVRAEVRPLTFRYIRKTAADMVRKLSDSGAPQ